MATVSWEEPLVLFSIGIAVIALRTYARISVVGWRHFEYDDYIMLLVALLYGGATGLAYVTRSSWHNLNNGGMTAEERAGLDPNSDEYHWRVNGSKAYIAIWVLFILVLWLQKTAMLTFFIRLTSSLGDYTMRIRLGFLFVALSYVVIVLYFFLDCLPIERTWQINPDPGRRCVPADIPILFVTLAMNVSTDLYISGIPLPLFWMAHIRLWKKLGLLVLVTGNIFIIVVSVVRVCMIISDPENGSRQAAPWSFRVMFVSIVTTNAPLLAPLLRKWCSQAYRALFGEKAEARLMRDLRTITETGHARDEARDVMSRTYLFLPNQTRRPSAMTYGSRINYHGADDCEDDTRMSGDGKEKPKARRPSFRRAFSEEAFV